jgi:hypothetical protein
MCATRSRSRARRDTRGVDACGLLRLSTLHHLVTIPRSRPGNRHDCCRFLTEVGRVVATTCCGRAQRGRGREIQMPDSKTIAGVTPKAHGAHFSRDTRRSPLLRNAVFVCFLGAFVAGCLNAQDRTDQSIQKMEALDDAACRQQTASVEEPMRAQAYAECRRLRVAYWQVGASASPGQQPANTTQPIAAAPLTPTQARQGAAWRTCAVTPNAPQC